MNPFERLLNQAGLPWAPPRFLSGGDMGEVCQLGAYVVKTHPAPPTGLFPAEGRGLKLLAKHGVPTPDVYFADETGIVMDWLPSGPDDADGLAQAITELHRSTGPEYGLKTPTFIGRFELGISGHSTDWPTFWQAHRINPLLRATWPIIGPLGPRIENLLRAFAAPTEGPCLLHGDLWNGNVVMSNQGAMLIDPSVWWGERAVDLAMMKLFGGFSPAFWSAYEARCPITSDVLDAIPFYQLYYLLVHVHFFGASYCRSVEQVLETYGV